MDLITTTADLAAACSRLAKHPVITVDTEFLRETTYYPLLCVVQMASAEEAIVIDTLAEGIDLKPFFELMANESVLKVFHAARQDIEIIWHQANIIPHPVFDTQVAAMVLGYGDSIAYDAAGREGHRPPPGQDPPLHRLVAPAADQGADALRGVRRHASARRVRSARCRPQEAPPQRMGLRSRWRS